MNLEKLWALRGLLNLKERGLYKKFGECEKKLINAYKILSSSESSFFNTYSAIDDVKYCHEKLLNLSLEYKLVNSEQEFEAEFHEFEEAQKSKLFKK
ncbi:MAG: hypothetical protein AABW67_03770 [Nanoarchaeota archaeon]